MLQVFVHIKTYHSEVVFGSGCRIVKKIFFITAFPNDVFHRGQGKMWGRIRKDLEKDNHSA